jgi:RecA/RadA recombinase
MAKKAKVESVSGSIFDIINSVDDGCEIIEKSAGAHINEYISTGSYILNAAISGSMFKGIPCGRVTTLAGAPGAGKSFLALSVCREAQKAGYVPVYLDSEGAQDVNSVAKLGVDTKKFMIKQVNTISEISTFVLNLCTKLETIPEENRDKIIIVLDSLGNLTSNKEAEDILNATGKRDMTKQQEIKALFRVCATPLAKLHIPFIVISHIYQTQDLFSKQVVSGGSGINYNSSVTLMLNAAKLNGADKDNDKAAENAKGELMKTGVIVTARPEKSRFTIPQKVSFYIPFFKAPNPYVGLDQYMTWENSGIGKGKCYTQKEYEKLKPAEQSACVSFEFEGETRYAILKDSARNIVVSHLGCDVPINELFTSKVFTDDFMKKFDEQVIRPAFELPDQSKWDNDDELVSELIDEVDE